MVSQKIKYSYGLVPAPLALSFSPPFTSGQRVKTGSEAKKGKGSGNGPGGRRARETHKQAENSRNKGTQWGGGGIRWGGE